MLVLWLGTGPKRTYIRDELLEAPRNRHVVVDSSQENNDPCRTTAGFEDQRPKKFLQ
jgi:hypothetical protein